MSGIDSLYGGYSTHPLPTRNAEGEKKERDIPKYVQEKAEQIEEERGEGPEYAFPVAWSIYCKYKEPNSPHCKKDKSEYFPSRSARRVASRYLRSELLPRGRG